MKRLPDDYFERIYRDADDPWGFATRRYEQRKYALTVAALPRERYQRAFEPGCSFGVLTELLAPRCDALFACDVVPSVVERARAQVARFDHVEVAIEAIPDASPSGSFDLAVLSEVLYYLSADALREFLTQLVERTTADAHVVAVHFRGRTDYPLSGDAVHRALRADSRFRSLGRYEEDAFVLDLLARGDA